MKKVQFPKKLPQPERSRSPSPERRRYNNSDIEKQVKFSSFQEYEKFNNQQLEKLNKDLNNLDLNYQQRIEIELKRENINIEQKNIQENKKKFGC